MSAEEVAQEGGSQFDDQSTQIGGPGAPTPLSALEVRYHLCLLRVI